MNCAYCQYGWTRSPFRYRGTRFGWPTAADVDAAVTARLQRAAECGELIDRITVAGHDEPTLHRDFEEITVRLRAIRDRIAPGVPLAILSNSTTAGWDAVRRALSGYDERYMKLDAGDPITYGRINDLGSSMLHVVDALSQLPPIVVQSMFVADDAGEIENSSDGPVATWIDAVERVHATAVHIYTLDRVPAPGSLHKVPRRRLREIAERVRTFHIPATVF